MFKLKRSSIWSLFNEHIKLFTSVFRSILDVLLFGNSFDDMTYDMFDNMHFYQINNELKDDVLKPTTNITFSLYSKMIHTSKFKFRLVLVYLESNFKHGKLFNKNCLYTMMHDMKT